MDKAKLIIALLIAIVTVIVVLQNTEAVETRLLFVTVTMPRVLMLFLMLVIGFILGIITALSRTRKNKTASSKEA
jgi:uncharacterized integral membrane protein